LVGAKVIVVFINP